MLVVVQLAQLIFNKIRRLWILSLSTHSVGRFWNFSRLLPVPLGHEGPKWQGCFDKFYARAQKVRINGWRSMFRKSDICEIFDKIWGLIKTCMRPLLALMMADCLRREWRLFSTSVNVRTTSCGRLKASVINNYNNQSHWEVRSSTTASNYYHFKR